MGSLVCLERFTESYCSNGTNDIVWRLDIDPAGHIKFTDLCKQYRLYLQSSSSLVFDSLQMLFAPFLRLIAFVAGNSRNIGIDIKAPALEAAIYQYNNPSTGSISIIDDSLTSPNGLAFSAEDTDIYLTNTGAVVPYTDSTLTLIDVPKPRYSTLEKRTLYVFGVSRDGSHIWKNKGCV